jgi:hypothetical protein
VQVEHTKVDVGCVIWPIFRRRVARQPVRELLVPLRCRNWPLFLDRIIRFIAAAKIIGVPHVILHLGFAIPPVNSGRYLIKGKKASTAKKNHVKDRRNLLRTKTR